MPPASGEYGIRLTLSCRHTCARSSSKRRLLRLKLFWIVSYRDRLSRSDAASPFISPQLVSFEQPRMRTLPSRTNRSEEHTSELQSLMRISYAVFCLKKKKKQHNHT